MLAPLLFTAGCRGGGPGSGAPGPGERNLLLITIDTLRADRVGAYGNAAIETPVIDRMAAEGVRFNTAITAAPTTLPSHASIFTGATPPRHGVRDNAAGVLPAGAATMAEAFQSRGFHTGAFVSAFVLDARWGLSQGFDVYDGPVVTTGGAPSGARETERIGEATLAAAAEWLEAQGEAPGAPPWFAWVHLFDPHAPYAAPEPYRSRYAAHPYDGEIAYVDALLGQLRHRLEASGQWPDTTVIVTSDHGESLREHGEPAHGFFLYESTLRVPLIVRLADNDENGSDTASAAQRGAVVETAVALIDLFPTVAELWSLEAGEGHEGRSLLPALRGDQLADVPIYSETMLPLLYFGFHDLRALRLGGEKLIEAPRPELYDLRSDAAEVADLAADRPQRVAELRTILEETVERAEAGTPASTLVDDPDRLAALRSLGYLRVGGGCAADGEDLADPKDKIEVYAAMMAALGAWQEGELESALRIIDEQVEADPGFAGAWHFRGIVLAGSGRHEEAITAFRRALEIDPGHALAGRELGMAYRSLDRYEEAAAVFKQVLAGRRDDADLRWELADSYLRTGNWEAAGMVLREGLEINADEPRMHFGLGIAALQARAPGDALAAFERAAQIAPYLPNLDYHRGEALEQLGRDAEALEAFNAAVEKQPAHYFAHLNRARLMAARGAPLHEIVAALRAALVARPGAPEAGLFLAQTLVDRGDRDDLAEAERLAVAGLAALQSPRLAAMGHATLGQIYDAQGRSDEAERERAKAEQLSRGR